MNLCKVCEMFRCFFIVFVFFFPFLEKESVSEMLQALMSDTGVSLMF